jgi:hypothetical protein
MNQLLLECLCESCDVLALKDEMPSPKPRHGALTRGRGRAIGAKFETVHSDLLIFWHYADVRKKAFRPILTRVAIRVVGSPHPSPTPCALSRGAGEARAARNSKPVRLWSADFLEFNGCKKKMRSAACRVGWHHLLTWVATSLEGLSYSSPAQSAHSVAGQGARWKREI